ncbi:MAG: hypothetical protein FJY85_08460, partial [Deltaproteobacteria bacterium]|nr:hypothetical protein [Deltaproteobacteria bacterium]
MERRKITARQVLADIRDGLSDAALMVKYGLSAQGLQSVFQKLLKLGVITQVELDLRVPASERTVDVGLFICTSCGTIQGKEFNVCPRCGASPQPEKEAGQPAVREEKQEPRPTQETVGLGLKIDQAARKGLSSVLSESSKPAVPGTRRVVTRVGSVAAYFQAMGIIAGLSYLLVMTGVLAIIWLTASEQFSSMTYLLIALVSVAMLATILFFL